MRVRHISIARRYTYLHYSSAADEEESRKRQAEDKRYIAAQLAKRTPEGDLNAGGGMIDSMLDLHAHGAGKSPDFMPKYDALVEKAERERAALHAAGKSTAEYDSHVAASARRFLKGEGHLSDAEINRRLSGEVNPLDVVKPYLNNDRVDGGPVKRRDQHADVMDGDASDIGARLKAAGVRVSDSSDATPAHGVTVQKPGLDQEKTVLGG